jgi:ATP-dependent RNA helicase DDX19/DBP5
MYEQVVMEFAEGIVPNPVVIQLKWEEESLDNIKQYYVMCRNLEDKYTAITNIYGGITIGEAMIFCHVSCLAAQTVIVFRMKK